MLKRTRPQTFRHRLIHVKTSERSERKVKAIGAAGTLVRRTTHGVACLFLSACLLTSCSMSPKSTTATEESFDEFYARMLDRNSIVRSESRSAAQSTATNVTSKNLNASHSQGSDSSTSRFTLPPPLLQLPQQRAARQEVEQSGVSPGLVKKMLAGEVISLAEIEELAQKKVSDDTIKKYLRSTGARYALTVQQIDMLRANAVSNEVIDFLLLASASRSAISYPLYVPLYPLRLYDPWWNHHHHHHFDIHHDFHRDAHH